MIIGITGPIGSGKDTAADYLKEKGFIHYSLSDILREEATNNNLEHTRENLVNIGNKLRKKHGNSILAKKTLEKITDKDYIITSIRHPDEIKALEDMYLINLNTPIEKRFERIKQRNRIGDPTSLEELKKAEQRENGKENEQQLQECYNLANTVLYNNHTLETLKEKLDSLTDSLNNTNLERPNWDEYFSKIAVLASERSTCERHHVGAVAVKNKKVLATGYNGAASGAKDCLDLGCLRNELNIPSGTMHEICRAIHAEQNVVAQAARHGTSIEDSTIYCTHSPCILCAKILANTGIEEFVTFNEYPDSEFLNLFKETGIKYRFIKKPGLNINFLK